MGLPHLHTLIIPGNNIGTMDRRSIPLSVNKVHLARNRLRDLNGTLRHLSDLQWLFLNQNDLTTLDGQLPPNAIKLKMLHAASNHIDHLPHEIRGYPILDHLFFANNQLTSLDRHLSRSKRLERAQLENNRISILYEDDFAEADSLQSLDLGHNFIATLNGSLLPLRKLRLLNFTSNLLTEFSWDEISRLRDLRILDLSFNKISYLKGNSNTNMVEWETSLTFLRLDHNNLQTLSGALSGLRSLLRLNLSFNILTHISPDDLVGLDQLTMLDISHNKLTTLEETSKTFLPKLEELIASYNYLKVLDRDFHGLPVLCWADLSNNLIEALRKDVVSKTHCRFSDGVHADKWGTLKIYLKENPILCDDALPEIVAALELNHTRLAGVTHCSMFDHLVTNKPNMYQYVAENTVPPIYRNHPVKFSNLITTNEMPQNDDADATLEAPTEQNQLKSAVNLEPLTTMEQFYRTEPHKRSHSSITQSQMLRIRELNSEIDELRARVSELQLENERLTMNLTNSRIRDSDDEMLEDNIIAMMHGAEDTDFTDTRQL